ncbi:hypothetical protein P3S67_022763 [Capsicum chacoense]
MHEDKSRNNGKKVEISPFLTLAGELGNSKEEQIAQAVMLALGVCEKAFFGSKNLLQLYESEG